LAADEMVNEILEALEAGDREGGSGRVNNAPIYKDASAYVQKKTTSAQENTSGSGS